MCIEISHCSRQLGRFDEHPGGGPHYPPTMRWGALGGGWRSLVTRLMLAVHRRHQTLPRNGRSTTLGHACAFGISRSMGSQILTIMVLANVPCRLCRVVRASN